MHPSNQSKTFALHMASGEEETTSLNALNTKQITKRNKEHQRQQAPSEGKKHQHHHQHEKRQTHVRTSRRESDSFVCPAAAHASMAVLYKISVTSRPRPRTSSRMLSAAALSRQRKGAEGTRGNEDDQTKEIT